MAFYGRPDLVEGRLLKEGQNVKQNLILQLFEEQNVRYRPQRISPGRLATDITEFGGEDREGFIEWIDNWNQASAVNGWTPGEEQVMLPLYSNSRASQFYHGLSPHTKTNINMLKER